MNFISVSFGVFFLVLLAVLKAIPSRRMQHLLLLIASYVFYATFDVRFLLLLVFMSIFVWLFGRLIASMQVKGKSAKIIVTFSIMVVVSILGFFKYFGFFLDSFRSLWGIPPVTLAILLPVGISFYVFQSISYICDVYSGKTLPASLLHVLLYIGFFPTIVSGPIQKSHEFIPQLDNRIEITKDSVAEGICRFLVGLIKKVVIADRLGICVTAVFSAPMAYSGLSLLFAAMAFSIQIYCDFSGYSDMAIGIAKCMNFDLGKNFNMPYLASNPSDFWKRWHISLSSWFRDYVYIPLGGSRKGEAQTYFNLFITMLLSGLWHGANWTFVLWGALHGMWSVAHRLYRKVFRIDSSNASKCIPVLLSTILSFSTVSLLWIVFKADSIETAWIYLSRMFTMADGIKYYYVFVPIYASLILGVHVYAALKSQGNDPFQPLDFSKFSSKLIFCMGCLLVLLFGYFGESAFIYAQF